MSLVTILKDGDDWSVWIQLEDGSKPTEGLAFVIGCGKTLDEAVADAVRDLEAAIDELHAVTEPAERTEP
jgi:hypothetical protein